MRLGDLDALKGMFRKRLQHYEYREDDYGIGRCGGMTDAMEMIDEAPTIPAITIEWLREKMRGYASALQSTEMDAVVRVLKMWEEDQRKEKSE